jgi:predicted permease
MRPFGIRFFSGVRERLRVLFFRGREEAELDEELRFHVELETAENLRRGLDPVEAKRRALLAFGGVERFKEEVRDARGVSLIENLSRDMRFAFRRLRREPGFTVPVVATLALGIGVVAAVFALVEGVLLRPLPYPEAERLVTLRHVAPGLGITDGGQSGGTYLHYAQHNRVFETMGLYFDRELSITEGEAPERIMTALVTPGVLTTLGVAPLLGRLFVDDGHDDASPQKVVLSHGLWVRRYGADPGIIGRTIELNRGEPHEIVGVMPAGFVFPRPETELWYAMPVEATRANLGADDLLRSAVARLRPGVSPAEAERDLARMITMLPEAYGDITGEELRRAELRGVVVPLKEAVVLDVRGALVLLAGMAVFLLLIVWANVGNLFLVRAERQRREVAVARSLGASGVEVARRFLLEGLLVTAAGGVLALALAWGVVASRFGFEPGQLPRLREVGVDGTVVGVMLGLSLCSGILLGVIAYLSAGRTELTGALKGALGRVTAGRKCQRGQRGVVAA